MKFWAVFLIVLSSVCSFAEDFNILTLDSSPRLDGVLDESEWPASKSLGPFTGISGKAVKAQTSAWIAQDDGGLWIAVECNEPNMGSLVCKTTRKGGRTWLDDGIEIFMGTCTDKRQYLHLAVNTDGVYFSELTARPSRPELVGQWDPAIKWACKKYKYKWTAELYIPFASIPRDWSFPWRINICRNRFAGNTEEYSSLAKLDHNFHRPDQFAVIKNVSIAKRIKVKPWGNFRCGIIDGRLFVKGNAQWKTSRHVVNFMLRFEDSNGRLIGTRPLDGPKLPLDVNIKLPARFNDAGMVRIVAVDRSYYPEAISAPLKIRKSNPLELFTRQPYYDIENMVTLQWSILEGYINKTKELKVQIIKDSKVVDSIELPLKQAGHVDWSIKDKPVGKYCMKVILTLDDGRAFTSELNIEKLPMPKKMHKVTLNERGIMLVDGKQFFPIGLYRLTPDMWAKYIPGTGFNVVHDMGAGAGRFKRNGDQPVIWDSIEKIQQIMDEAQRVGVKVLFEVGVYVKHTMEVERGEENAERLREVVSRFRRHPALLAYYLIDEPYSKDYKRAARAREIIRQIDPYHPTVSPSLGYDYSYKPTSDLVDVLLVSCYPVLPDDPDAAAVSRRLNIVRDKVGMQKPIWFVPQAVGMLPAYYSPNYKGDKNKYVFPTADQEQSMVYQSFLMKGNARGLIFFAWFGDRPRQSGPIASTSPEFWRVLKDLTFQLQKYRGLIFAQNIDTIKSELDDGLLVSVRKFDGSAWIILVNTLDHPGQLKVEIPKNCQKDWVEINKHSKPEYNDKGLLDNFKPWEVKIWKGPADSLEKMKINAAYSK